MTGKSLECMKFRLPQKYLLSLLIVKSAHQYAIKVEDYKTCKFGRICFSEKF